MVGAIRASATPDRADRLFPGDIDQLRFPGGGLGLAHGAAGVLYALTEAAGVRVPEYEEWLVTRVAEPPKGMRLGLYDGLAGVAYTLARLGHPDAAARAALSCLGENWDRLGHSLYGGLSGFALAMISVGDHVGEPRLADAAIRAAETVAAPYAAAGGAVRPRDRGRVPWRRRPAARRVGEGTAVHPLVRADRRPGLPRRRRGCHSRRPGTMRHRRQWRAAGRRRLADAAVPRPRQRRHRHGDRPVHGAPSERGVRGRGPRDQARRQLRLLRAGRPVQRPRRDDRLPVRHTRRERAGRGRRVVGAQVDRLAWHAVRYAGGLAFPGDMLLRLSMDLGTGTAGVLLGTAAALAPGGAALPFFARPASLPVRVPGSSPAPVQGASNQPALARR